MSIPSSFFKKLKADKYIFAIVIVGLLLRLSFYFVGAEIYHGKKNFYIGGDTYSFITPIKNLIEHGTLSVDLNQPKGAFGREPGYSLFLGPFYLLFGDNIDLLCRVVCWFQILLDTLCIFLFYKTALNTFQQVKIARLAAILYAIYPFSIIWTSIVYAESISTNILILIMYYLSLPDKRYRYLIVGGLIAIDFFIRPQLLFLLPAVGLTLLFIYKKNAKQWLSYGMQLALGFFIVYSPWPIRNYVFHQQFELFRDISTMRAWQDDVMNFHKYIVSMQVDWEPQFTQIITSNEPVPFPKAAFVHKEDSLTLLRAIDLSRTCSDGFASFMKKDRITETNCTQETAQLWETLYQNQVKYNKLNFFLLVPLQNLKKALFKITLVQNWKSPKLSPVTVLLVGTLFSYRSLLILMGIIGCIFYFRQKKQAVHFVVLCSFLYFLIWYFWMCFVFRGLEMRYFLPADVLLLFPAAFLVYTILNRFSFFRKYLA